MKNLIARFYAEERGKMISFVRKRVSYIQGMEEEDIVQDVMTGVWNTADVSKPIRDLSAYVYPALRNRITDIFRRKKNDVSFDSAEDSESGLRISDFVADMRYDIEDESEKSEISDLLFEALDVLKSEDREIICLTEFEGKSFRECSEILGEPVGTLLSRKNRAMKKMKVILCEIGFSMEDYYD